MKIEVDYNPSPDKAFFLSIPLDEKEKECLSFDYTTKGHRIIKQVLVDKKPFPKDKKDDGGWDVLVIEDGKYTGKYHVQWIDMDERDWCNDEIWETVWEKSITKTEMEEILKYSQLISDNYQTLDKHQKEIKDLEKLLKNYIKKLS